MGPSIKTAGVFFKVTSTKRRVGQAYPTSVPQSSTEFLSIKRINWNVFDSLPDWFKLRSHTMKSLQRCLFIV